MTSDGTNAYSWDAENRLLKITYPSTATSQFSYDALGGLVKIVESTGSTKQFVRTSDEMLEERDAASAVQARFFAWGQTRGATNCYYTADHLGSIRDVTTSAGTEQYSYDPYGNATATGSGTQSDFQFCGYYFHAPSGLNLTLNRAYSPTLGRFINRDPIEEEGGVNLYAYVDNEPIGTSDPLGLQGVVTINSQYSEGNLGHTWDTFTPDKTGITEINETWRGQSGAGEHEIPGQILDRSPVASKAVHIDARGEARYRMTVIEYNGKGKNAWKLWHPCTGFACKAFNNAVPKPQRIKPALTPEGVCKNINK
jgi:RHS repeat-associated protein